MGWLVAGIYAVLLTLAFVFGGADLALSVLLAVVALFVGLRPDLASRAITDWAHRTLPRERAGSPS